MKLLLNVPQIVDYKWQTFLCRRNNSIMSEKLRLEWQEFRENIANTFGSLRENADFADVTLVCKDGQQLKKHTKCSY